MSGVNTRLRPYFDSACLKTLITTYLLFDHIDGFGFFKFFGLSFKLTSSREGTTVEFPALDCCHYPRDNNIVKTA